MQSSTSSRLAKHEQAVILRQTLLYVFGGIGLLLLFVLVLMPAAIRLFFKTLDSGNKVAEVSDTVPPQVPVLSLPFQATNSATIQLMGYGESNTTVIIMANGVSAAEVPITAEGTFNHELRLEQGETTLEVYGKDAAQNESVKSTGYRIFSDPEPLKIDVSDPVSPTEVVGKKNQQLTINGKTKPNTKLYLNDRLNYAKADGSFSITHQLAEGENKLKLRGVDPAGNTTELELVVQFKL